MCTLDPGIAGASGTHVNEAVHGIGKGNLPVFLHLQVVMNKLFSSVRRLRVTSLQRTRSMCTYIQESQGPGTHATKLWMEVGRETCQFSCTCRLS